MPKHHSDRRAHRVERRLRIEAERATDADGDLDLVAKLEASLAATGVFYCAGCGAVRVLEPGHACRRCFKKLTPPDAA